MLLLTTKLCFPEFVLYEKSAGCRLIGFHMIITENRDFGQGKNVNFEK